MKKATKPIGLDANFREVFPGDEVRDADGHGYTITAAGWAKPLTGGSEIAFKRLKDPVLVRQVSKFAEGPDGKVGPAPGPVKAVPRSAPDPEPAAPGPLIRVSGPWGDRPTAEELAAKPSKADLLAVKSRNTGGRTGLKPSNRGKGKPNQSGWSKLYNICRNVGIPGQGITGYLRDHGFEVFRAEGTSCVKVEDREKVVAFLRDNPPPAGLPKTSSYDGVARRIRKDVEAGEARKEGPAIVTTDPAKVFTKFDAFLILEDADMVAELRARGWTVTCTKTQSL